MNKQEQSSEPLQQGRLSEFLNNVLTVDVGWNTGWASWKGDNTPIFGLIRESRNKTVPMLEDRLASMFREFSALLHLMRPVRVIMEGVEKHGGTAGSASMDSGDLFVLSYLVGGYAALAKMAGCSITIVTASRWKGQLSKEAVQERVSMVTNTKYQSEHVTDAVGLGLAAVNLL